MSINHSGFASDGKSLTWTGDGEYLRIEPWGKGGVRVRSALMHEPNAPNMNGALLDVPLGDAAEFTVSIEGSKAYLTNGDVLKQPRPTIRMKAAAPAVFVSWTGTTNSCSKKSAGEAPFY